MEPAARVSRQLIRANSGCTYNQVDRVNSMNDIFVSFPVEDRFSPFFRLFMTPQLSTLFAQFALTGVPLRQSRLRNPYDSGFAKAGL